MTLQTEPFPLAAGDAELETHVKDAFVPCLLAALALALDAPERFLTDELRPKPVEDLVQAIFDSVGVCSIGRESWKWVQRLSGCYVAGLGLLNLLNS